MTKNEKIMKLTYLDNTLICQSIDEQKEVY